MIQRVVCFFLYTITLIATDKSIHRFSTSIDPFEDSKIMDGAGDRKILTADYNELLEAQKKGDLIIDVREDSEINETGKLPGSIHIPSEQFVSVFSKFFV